MPRACFAQIFGDVLGLPAYKICLIFSDTLRVLKICLCTSKYSFCFPRIESEKTPKEIQHTDFFFVPLSPLRNFFVSAKQAKHKEFQGLKAPKRRWIQAWNSW